MIYHVRQLISLTLVRQESLLAFLVGLFAWFQDTRQVMMEQNHQTPKVNSKRKHLWETPPKLYCIYLYHPYTNAYIYIYTPTWWYAFVWGSKTGNNTKQLISLSQHPIPRDDSPRFPNRPTGIFCVSTSLQGWWSLATAEWPKKKTLEIPVRCMGSKDSDCDGLFFGGPSQLKFRLVFFFWFFQSSWDVSTLSTQTFLYTLPFNETNIACCMKHLMVLEVFPCSHLSESPGCLATTFYGSPTSSLTGQNVRGG